MSDYRKDVFKALGVFIVVSSIIKFAMSRVGQPWAALLLVLGFVSIGVCIVVLFRVDRKHGR